MIFKKRTLLPIVCLFFSCNIFESSKSSTDVTLDYKVDGLSKEVKLEQISPLKSFDENILNGYSNIQELSDDLDSLALEKGIIYIKNFDYNWYGCYVKDNFTNKDDCSYQSEIIKNDGSYIYSASDSELIVTDLNNNIVQRVGIFSNEDIKGFSIEDNNITLFSDYALDYDELFDGLFNEEPSDIRDLITPEDRKRALKNLTINIPSWRNKVIQNLFYENGEIDNLSLKNILRIYKPDNGSMDNLIYRSSINEI